jgi:hypothetical protein
MKLLIITLQHLFNSLLWTDWVYTQKKIVVSNPFAPKKNYLWPQQGTCISSLGALLCSKCRLDVDHYFRAQFPLFIIGSLGLYPEENSCL